jgi:hypothetical protein
MGYGLDDGEIGVQFLAGGREFPLLHNISDWLWCSSSLLSNG